MPTWMTGPYNTAGTGAPSVPIVLERAFPLPALNTAFIDTGTLFSAARIKVIYVQVTTALTWTSAGQATVQPFVSQNNFTAAGGGASALTVAQVLLGAVVNIGGASVTTLAINSLFRVSPTNTPDLQWFDPYVGLELKFPSALTGGVLVVWLEESTI